MYKNHEVYTDPPSQELFQRLYKHNDYDRKKYINTSGVKYREMGLKDRLPSMDDEAVFALLSSEGKLVKRPLLVDGTKVLIGFKETEWEAFFRL